MQVLMLTLNTFSRTGGIQLFNRSVHLALQQATEPGTILQHWSLYDRDNDIPEAYKQAAPQVQFKGFDGNKRAFAKALWQNAAACDIILWGHINLARLSLLPRLRVRKQLVFCHGIEVWSIQGILKKWAAARMDKLLCVSHYTQNRLQQQGIPAEKLALFPNCLHPFFAAMPLTDTAVWKQRWRIDETGFYLLTLARLEHTQQQKGYDAIIKALPALAVQYPKIRYILAGKWDNAEYIRIRQLAENLGVNHRLLMPGFVPEEWLPALYNLCRVFAMPSSKEGFGIVFLEAGWWGCRLVAADAGGAPEALLQGKLGVLVPPDNAEALLQALQQQLAIPRPTAAELAARRALIDAHFGFGRMVERVRELVH
jgi:glycosyltransferase involved in cell wall biosynthesis